MQKKVVILDLYRNSPFRISKDTCGGYGTENDFGHGLIAKSLGFIAKLSLFWPPLAALNLLSEFKNNNLFSSTYSQDINDIDNSIDYVFISTSIVCANHELSETKKLVNKFPKIKFFAFGSFLNIFASRYREIGVATITGEPEFLFQSYTINYKNLNLFHINGNVDVLKKDPNNLSLPLWVNDKNTATKNFLFGYKNGYLPILATRGCPYSCYEYCVYPLQQGRRINAVNPEKLIEDLNYLHNKVGSKNFVFRDPVFSINRKYTNDLLNEIEKNNHKNFSFTVETHLNNIDDDLARLFKSAGVDWVKFGIESAVDDVKNNVNRYSLKNDEQIDTVAICSKNNLKTVAMYILCQPEDNYETHKLTMDYSRKLGTNLAQFSLFTPYPGTPYYEKNKDMINCDNFELFNQYNLVFKHKFFNSISAKKELGRAYSNFYFNKALKFGSK